MINLGVSMAEAIRLPTNPFPGLRPFEFEESHLFFGRDSQIETLIATLAETRFLAVVGTSGSGKSSLVRAGLLPALLSGMMTKAGSRWRMAITHPGSDPIANLALAMNEADAFGGDGVTVDATQVAIDEATLRRGSRGLCELACQHALAPDENLLVLVDQFEEIFRFAREAARQSKEGSDRYENDSAAFIKQLLEARVASEAKIFVVLTMRSDFLGDCAKFWDLPEAINDSQYLIPRLTRDQLRDVITGPITLCEGEITPRLLHQMLNDIIDDQDQLPVLQHLLMCIWNEWKALQLKITQPDGSVCDHRDVHEGDAIDICCYDAVGGMAEALSRHAQHAYDSLPDDRHRQVAEKLFKTLTEKGIDNREVRRPATVSQIRDVAAATEAEVGAVVDAFRKPSRSFLLPKAGTPLETDSVIDISHESLIRGWKLLKCWVEEESEAVREYRRLADAAELKKQEGTNLWRGADLQRALKWRNDNQPNKAWADRYCPGFELGMAFLAESEAERDRLAAEAEREKQAEAERAARELQQAKDLATAREERLQEQKQSATRLRKWLRVAAVLVVVSLVLLIAGAILLIVVGIYSRNLNVARGEAQRQTDIALKTGYVANVTLAHQAFAAGYFGQVVNSLENYRLGLDNPETDPRGFLWYYLWSSTHNETATLTGHTDTVEAVAFLPDGKSLVSGGDDKTVKVWDVSSQKVRAEIKHDATVEAVAVSESANLIASADEFGIIKLIDLANLQVVGTLAHPPPQGSDSPAIYAVAFSPDGKLLAAGCDDKSVLVWDVTSRSLVKTLADHTQYVSAVAFSPDGNLLASGSYDGTTKLWNLKTWEPRTLDMAAVHSLAFSPDSKTLAVGGADRSITLWNPAASKASGRLLGHFGDIYAIAFAQDGASMASASTDGMIKIWDTTTHKVTATLAGHAGVVRAVAFSPDATLASASDDGTVKIWNTRRPDRMVARYVSKVYSLDFSPDAQTMAVADDDHVITLWHVPTVKSQGNVKNAEAVPPQSTLNTGASGYARQVAFSRDGKVLGAVMSDGSVTLWDRATNSELRHFNAHSPSLGQTFAFAPDGKTFATGGEDHAINLWETNTGRLIATAHHADVVYSLSFSPDGKTLASGSLDETVRLWDAASLKSLGILGSHSQGVLCVAFSPDGKVLASGSFDNTIKLWDMSTRRPRTLTGHSQGVLAIAFSPDGKTLASVSYDHQAKLWDIAIGQELCTLTQESHQIDSVAFSKDGLTLATGGFDHVVKFWFAASPDQVPRVVRPKPAARRFWFF